MMRGHSCAGKVQGAKITGETTESVLDGAEQAGAACLLFGCLIHEAAQGWTRVRWVHFAAGAGKANQGFVAWDARRADRGRIGLLFAGVMLGAGQGIRLSQTVARAAPAAAMPPAQPLH